MEAVDFLRSCLLSPAADRSGAEDALTLWLEGREDEAGMELLARWRQLAPEPGQIPTAAQDNSRRKARAMLLGAD